MFGCAKKSSGKKDGKAKKIMPNGDIYEINYKNGEKGEIKKIEK